MNMIKFLKEPGYTYDLFFIFILYFNREQILKDSILPDDDEYCDKIRRKFLPIPEELLLFFYLTEGNRSFIADKYFDPYKEMFFLEKYDLSIVLTALADYDQVVKNVLHFYFRNENAQELEPVVYSLQQVNLLIKASNYPSEVKNALYAFFIDPIPMIQKLIYELMAKEIKLAQQYEKEFFFLQNVQECFDYDLFAEKARQMEAMRIDLEDTEKVYVTFSVHNRYILYYQLGKNASFLLLGIEYRKMMSSLMQNGLLPQLDLFGTVVSEKNRVEILNFMHRNGEVTIKDIEQELGFTGTNSYYHLSLMMKAGMLNTRNQGRTVLYRIDQEYFESLIEGIKKYTKKGV